jgi:hypothetical protein
MSKTKRMNRQALTQEWAAFNGAWSEFQALMEKKQRAEYQRRYRQTHKKRVVKLYSSSEGLIQPQSTQKGVVKTTYPHKYKYGKQEEVIEVSEFAEAMQRAEAMGETLNHLAYCTALWHTGVRKSELYERPLSDVTVTKKFVTIDFHQRKKHGAQVPPLDIPRSFYGVEDWLVPHIFSRINSKPSHRWSKKNIQYQVETGETKVNKWGKTVPVKEWHVKQVREIWLFPHIGSTTSWDLVKRILGDRYYPHYLRLRKLSAVGGNPETATFMHLKSVSGIKTLRSLQAYLGISKKAQTQAMQVE